LVSGDAAVRDLTGGIHLSEAGEADQRSLKEAETLGATEDIVGDQSSKYSEPKPGEENERQ